MKILFAFLLLSFASFAQSTYHNDLEKARAQHQIDFPKEVLDSTELASFQGICYYPIDTNFKVQAHFKRVRGKAFVMPMSKARTVYYKQYGELTFRINDTLCTLKVYQNLSLKGNPEYKDYLFLPFKDATTAISTYGAGRYLDVYKTKGKIWMIDFNKAYHPYCAYSDRYSCPIVPSENTISPAINAGECYENHH